MYQCWGEAAESERKSDAGRGKHVRGSFVKERWEVGMEPGSDERGQIWEFRVKERSQGGRSSSEFLGSMYPTPPSAYRVTQKPFAGVSHCSQGIIHISLARQAADTAVQCLGHCFSHLGWERR